MFAIANLSNPRFNYTYKGFTSIVTQIIEVAKMHRKVYHNDRVLVQDDQVLRCFDSTFIPEPEESFYDAGDVYLSKYFAGEIDTSHSAHTLANDEDLKERSQILGNILRIKPDLLKRFERKRERLFGNKQVLGLQIRGTDKKNEVQPPNINSIIQLTRDAIHKNSIDLVYIATDDISYLNPIKKEFGSIVVFDVEKEVSKNGSPLHLYQHDREKLNEQVLEDVYLLSVINHFLYSFSNVSHLALIMGINSHMTKVNINLI